MKKQFEIKHLLKKRKNILFLIFLVLVCIFFAKNIFLKSNFKDKIIMLKEPKTKTINLPARALVIKDEYLYYLGENDFKEDGLKINVNKELADVDVSNVDENLKNHVSSVIDKFNEKLDEKDSDSKNFNLDGISYYIREKNFFNAFSEVNKISKVVPNKKVYVKDKLFRYSLLDNTFKTGKILSKNSGVVSNKIDGLENIYDFSIIDLLDEDDFNFENSKSSSFISGIKIVDNLRYYLCLKTKHDMISDVDVNSSLLVNFGSDSFEGIVKKIKRNSSSDLFVLEFYSGFDEILDKRFLDVNIEKSFNKIYELPKSSLMQEDGENYIISVDSFNNMKKIKVVVKFIDNVNDKVYIDAIKSYIGPFYNILKDARLVKKGEISN
ncbi:hypothetical protein HMPREF3188_00329 [Tissierellia bacterium KA00581]|nr:hypothetical protein HMPREF3188_00329 [Tissierellia bacterium KA00581]